MATAVCNTIRNKVVPRLGQVMTTSSDSLGALLYAMGVRCANDVDAIVDAVQETKQAIHQLIDAEIIAELERLKETHREVVYWGDGSPSDLDNYLSDRQAELKAKETQL